MSTPPAPTSRREGVNVNGLVRFLFSLVWRRRLRRCRLVQVTGWRSCLIDNEWGRRERVTFLFGKHPPPSRPAMFGLNCPRCHKLRMGGYSPSLCQCQTTDKEG